MRRILRILFGGILVLFSAGWAILLLFVSVAPETVITNLSKWERFAGFDFVEVVWVIGLFILRIWVIVFVVGIGIYVARKLSVQKNKKEDQPPIHPDTSLPYDMGLKYLVKRLIEEGYAESNEKADAKIKEQAYHGNLTIYGQK